MPNGNILSFQLQFSVLISGFRHLSPWIDACFCQAGGLCPLTASKESKESCHLASEKPKSFNRATFVQTSLLSALGIRFSFGSCQLQVSVQETMLLRVEDSPGPFDESRPGSFCIFFFSCIGHGAGRWVVLGRVYVRNRRPDIFSNLSSFNGFWAGLRERRKTRKTRVFEQKVLSSVISSRRRRSSSWHQ